MLESRKIKFYCKVWHVNEVIQALCVILEKSFREVGHFLSADLFHIDDVRINELECVEWFKFLAMVPSGPSNLSHTPTKELSLEPGIFFFFNSTEIANVVDLAGLLKSAISPLPVTAGWPSSSLVYSWLLLKHPHPCRNNADIPSPHLELWRWDSFSWQTWDSAVAWTFSVLKPGQSAVPPHQLLDPVTVTS